MPTLVRGAVSCVVLSGAAKSASRKTVAMVAAEFKAVFASRELTLDIAMIMCKAHSRTA